MLTAAAPSLGAPASNDGWRARGSAKPTTIRRTGFKPARAAVRQVAWEDDLAGPALRVAGRIPTDRAYDRGYRVAQSDRDGLRDAFERPFGMNEEPRPANQFNDDADQADRLFDDLPEEPTYQDEPTYTEDAFGAEERAPTPDTLFDDMPQEGGEEIGPGEPVNDDIANDLAGGPEADPREAKFRSEAMQDCSEALAELKGQRLDAIDLSIGINGVEGEAYPYICSLEDGSVFAPRCWSEITYTWKASGLCHKPLYFEDIHLERYGHSWGPIAQPLLSGAHFFGTLPILPYKMGLKTPNECVYTLGHYRPGECAPYLIDPIPFTWRAAIFQAGGTMGVVGILP